MKKKIVVIDGQGGKLGVMLVSKLKGQPHCEIYGIGTNGIATAAMMKAGAHYGATGENPVIVNCRDADSIVGPIGIVIADALFGEVTPVMAVAVGQSAAKKVFLPVNRCNNYVSGVKDLPVSEMIDLAVLHILSILKEDENE